MDGVTWLAESVHDGELCFRIGTRGAELIGEWPGLAMLVAARDASSSRLTFEPGVDPREIEKIRRGSAWLLLRHVEGRLGLHGSAVSAGGRAVVFLGRSGEGKSTFAAAMCRRGCDLLADDAVGVEERGPARWDVVPHEMDHWLDAEARRALGAPPSTLEKEPWRSARAASAPVPLAVFVELAFIEGSAPRLIRRQGSHAVQSLIPQVARFVLDEPERQRRELDALHAVIEHAPVYLLERPRAFEQLDLTVDMILELVGVSAP